MGEIFQFTTITINLARCNKKILVRKTKSHLRVNFQTSIITNKTIFSFFFQNERGYTQFPVNFRKVDIYSTGSDYKGFTIQIEAPMETRFQCRTEDRPFSVPRTFFMINSNY